MSRPVSLELWFSEGSIRSFSTMFSLDVLVSDCQCVRNGEVNPPTYLLHRRFLSFAFHFKTTSFLVFFYFPLLEVFQVCFFFFCSSFFLDLEAK